MATDEQAGEGRVQTSQGRGSAVAVLLAVAAVSTALVGGRAALLGDSGSDRLNQVLREDVRQGARVVGDARRLYEEDASVAHRVAEAQLIAEQTDRAAARESGDAAATLEAESEANAGVAEVLSESSTLARGSPQRALRLEGADLLERFAEIRAERSAELAALDPDATQTAAEDETRASSLMTAAIIPIGVAFLLGALAETFVPSRSRLLAGGYACVAIGILAAIAVEVSL